jgi:hypothetical protein
MDWLAHGKSLVVEICSFKIRGVNSDQRDIGAEE